MTGLSAFEPGSELECAACQFRTDVHPGCLIAAELADDGEHMTPACCPVVKTTACPVCGGALPCPTCLAELRMDAA